MRRLRPIRRLVDGTPDASGRAIARRAVLLVAPAMIGANFAGAAVVFALAAWVVPTPDLDEPSTTIILWNLVAGGVVPCSPG